MSGADHAILDLGEEELQFTNNDYKTQTPSTASMTEFPSPENRDTEQLVGEDRPAAGGTSNFWTLAYYQQYFDVDTSDVTNRLMYSMVPVPGKSFLQHHIRPRPDLYGPFWICVTLVFSIAISGNVADFLQKSVALNDHKWHYDFHKVSLAATAVFSYASLLPAGLYGFLWWAGGAGASGAALSFLELVCLYGYSLAIYVPVSILWLVQVSWWQWICVLLGAGLSGAVLFMPIWPAVRDGAARSAWIVMGVILCLHLLLACGFMLYFFHVPPTVEGGGGANSTVVTVAAQVQEAEAKNGSKEAGEEVQEKDVAPKEDVVKKEDVAEKEDVAKKDDVARSTRNSGQDVAEGNAVEKEATKDDPAQESEEDDEASKKDNAPKKSDETEEKKESEQAEVVDKKAEAAKGA